VRPGLGREDRRGAGGVGHATTPARPNADGGIDVAQGPPEVAGGFSLRGTQPATLSATGRAGALALACSREGRGAGRAGFAVNIAKLPGIAAACGMIRRISPPRAAARGAQNRAVSAASPLEMYVRRWLRWAMGGMVKEKAACCFDTRQHAGKTGSALAVECFCRRITNFSWRRRRQLFREAAVALPSVTAASASTAATVHCRAFQRGVSCRQVPSRARKLNLARRHLNETPYRPFRRCTSFLGGSDCVGL
jgi:hypothetical protein